MNCRLGIAIATLALTLCPAASAQTVIAADNAKLQPLVYRSGAVIDGCGLRGVVLSINDLHSVTIIDFSVTVRTDPKNLYGLGKAGAYETDPQKGLDQRRDLPVTSFLIAAEDGSVSTAPDKTIPADTPGFILGGMEIEEAAKILAALQEGNRTQIGVQINGEALKRIYSFNATISDPNRNSFFACMNSFFKTANDNIEKMEAK